MRNLTHPIILAHGIARFDFLLQHFTRNITLFGFDAHLPADGLHYFKGIARHLRNNGFDVHHTAVSFAAGLTQRAGDLHGEVQRVLEMRGAERVHIIAHSMGGLDARCMIVNHGMADRVASLTTIGTPHLGTTLADRRLSEQGDAMIAILRNVIDLRGFQDLTTEACARFNTAAVNAEATNSVFYQTYASAEERRLIFAPLQRAWRVINEREGMNDGLVSLTSQQWNSQLVANDGTVKTIKQHKFPVSADHLNEVGWWDINQLKDFEWGTSFIRAAETYEAKVRDVYLDIANDLAQAFPIQSG